MYSMHIQLHNLIRFVKMCFFNFYVQKKKLNKLYVLVESLTNVAEQIYKIIHFKDFVTCGTNLCLQQPQYFCCFMMHQWK
jgi:hypothetical protein